LLRGGRRREKKKKREKGKIESRRNKRIHPRMEKKWGAPKFSTSPVGENPQLRGEKGKE